MSYSSYTCLTSNVSFRQTHKLTIQFDSCALSGLNGHNRPFSPVPGMLNWEITVKSHHKSYALCFGSARSNACWVNRVEARQMCWDTNRGEYTLRQKSSLTNFSQLELMPKIGQIGICAVFIPNIILMQQIKCPKKTLDLRKKTHLNVFYIDLLISLHSCF